MEFSKAYEPNKYEPLTYALWEGNDAFAPSGKGKPYGIVMPPPNANGDLHIGHGFEMNLKDILVRYHRMKGFDTAYIPGADHAGFETWVVYERALEKAGKSRFDFTRDELYDQVWDFVAKQRGNMELQIRALGISCSWKDLVFTLDKKVIDTVYDTFKKMWDDNLIYRDKRLVNYCTTHNTSFSDIEVVYKEEKGTLWDIAYPLTDGEGELVISTTRPETLLGDTAVAINPEDNRYAELVGKKVKLPLTDREIPVIADSYVDIEFGTGVVKITPAHDQNDHEVGERHNLPRVTVIGFDGKMTEDAGSDYTGLTVLEARKKVLQDLKGLGLRRGEKKVKHNVGHCYKCRTVIEPLLKEQWFVKVKPLTRRAIQAIENNEIQFFPESKGKVLTRYYENLRDWNISRQIPWGIPIPAFYNKEKDEWIFDTRVEEKSIVVDDTTYTRDEDTLDTWFSSGQWPFITTDYLTNGDLARFYPNSVMEHGIDILFPWSSRMIMLGLYITDKVPYRDLYVHGMVLDEKGQKMSKSKGNVVNPMEIVAKYGSDAFRMGIVAGRSAGMNQAFAKSKVIAARNLCNKLWNIARFVQDELGDSYAPDKPVLESPADHWIMSRLTEAQKGIESNLDAYRFADAGELVYQTIWSDVADWYIETSKTNLNRDVLAYVLEICLKLAHPFAPFVTEAIWQNLSWTDDTLISTAWPKIPESDAESAKQFEQITALIAEVRFVTNELPSNKRYPLLYKADKLIESNAALIKRLARLPEIRQTDSPRGMQLALPSTEAWLDVEAEVVKSHHTNLSARLAEVDNEITRLAVRLQNENYLTKAPAELIDETKQKLRESRELAKRLRKELEIIDTAV